MMIPYNCDWNFQRCQYFGLQTKNSKNPLFWIFNGCLLFYNHTPKPNKEEQNMNLDFIFALSEAEKEDAGK